MIQAICDTPGNPPRKAFCRARCWCSSAWGVLWGAPDDLQTFLAMVANVPAEWTWPACSLGAHQMPYAAASVFAGDNVRVGLEDNLYLERGRLATNAELVERAVIIIEHLGARLLGRAEVRERLRLTKRDPA